VYGIVQYSFTAAGTGTINTASVLSLATCVSDVLQKNVADEGAVVCPALCALFFHIKLKMVPRAVPPVQWPQEMVGTVTHWYCIVLYWRVLCVCVCVCLFVFVCVFIVINFVFIFVLCYNIYHFLTDDDPIGAKNMSKSLLCGRRARQQ
jgi:hypothetical protein